MRVGIWMKRERGVAAAVAAMVVLAGCAVQAPLADPTTTVGNAGTSSVTSTTTTPTTALSTEATATIAPCGKTGVGLDPDGGPSIGPVVVCIDVLVSSDRLPDAGVVAPGHLVADAEAALAALGAMDEFTTPEGLMNLIPAGFDDGMEFTRSDGTLDVSLPARFRELPALGTSANNDAFLLQMFGTAFTDPTVEQVRFDLAGDPAAFCAMVERDPDCAAMTRGEFFGP